MRATQLRWPLRLLSRGRAVDLVNLELKAALVNGGYAVVTVDVRGTGGLTACTSGLLLQRSQALHKVIMFSLQRPELLPPATNPHLAGNTLNVWLSHARRIIWPVACTLEPRRAAGLCASPRLHRTAAME